MREAQSKAIHLKDYAPPAFLIGRVTLDVDIRVDDALVKTMSPREYQDFIDDAEKTSS